jgi:hypothetical protein
MPPPGELRPTLQKALHDPAGEGSPSMEPAMEPAMEPVMEPVAE